jgi:hypothetical protein
MCLWGSHRYISSHREVISKTPHFQDVNGDFQLKRFSAYIGTEEIIIIALDGSKCVSQQDTQCAVVKTKGRGSFQGSNLQNFVSKANLQPNFKPQAENVA